MTKESLDNLCVNLRIHHANIGKNVNKLLKYGGFCYCQEVIDFLILDAIIDTFERYRLPCIDSDENCVKRALNSQIKDEVCGYRFSGNTTIHSNQIRNVANTDISGGNLEVGVYLTVLTDKVLAAGTYITDIIAEDATHSSLILNHKCLATKTDIGVVVDCSQLLYYTKNNCLSASEMLDLLNLANKICCSNYQCTFELTEDE